MANLYIMAGPNGTGKTTAAYTLLPEVMKIKEFVNADEIARGLSPFNVEAVAFEAARIMLQRIEQLMSQGVDFAIEKRCLRAHTYKLFVVPSNSTIL